MKQEKHEPLIGDILRKIAPRIGARVLIEPEWRAVGQITFKNGKRSYFRYNSIGANTLGAAEVSTDKDYANYFMRKMGYPTIPGKTFFSEPFRKTLRSSRGIEAAARYARKLGYPIVVKPNSGSQGRGVHLVTDEKQLRRALRVVLQLDRVALVQKAVQGNDYRIVVMDGKVISAYERIPLNVVGDGRTSIAGLLRKKQREFRAAGRDTRLDIRDPRITHKVRKQRLSLSSVPVRGQRVFLLDNANLSSGGDSVDVTKQIHADFKDLAIDVTKDMGLTLCGVDLMVEGDIREPLRRRKHWILEINSAPGLDHYAQAGAAQRNVVEALYLEVLRRIERLGS